MAEYAIGLVILAILAVLTGRREIVSSAMVVALSWTAWCGFILATEIYEPWHFGILLDSAAAWFLLRNPSSRMKALLGSIFTVQVSMHVAYACVLMVSGSADYDSYYNQLSVTSWLQLFIAGAWAGGSNIYRLMPVRRVVYPPLDNARPRDIGDAS